MIVYITCSQLLDQCASRVVGPSSQGTKFPRRLFDANGDEVTDVYSLQTEQELFLSMGEPFKEPYGMFYWFLCAATFPSFTDIYKQNHFITFCRAISS